MPHPLRVRVVLTFSAACLVAAAPATAQREIDRTPRDLAPERVAILPFGNISGAPGDDWIGAGIAETLAAELQGPSAVDVIGRELVSETMRTLDVPGSRPPAHAVILEVGRRLGVRRVITGGYQRLGNQLRITGRLMDVATGTVVRAAKVDGGIGDLFELQDRLAAELVNRQASDVARVAGRSAPRARAAPPSIADATTGAEGSSSAPPDPTDDTDAAPRRGGPTHDR